MEQLSATRCSRIAILSVSLVSFATITLRVASQRVFVVVYFVSDSVRKIWIHPASYPMGNRGSGSKAAGREADHSTPSSAKVKERVELYIHSPNMPSSRGG
jgi:hypothetical protein